MDDSIKNIFIVALVVVAIVLNIRIDNLNSEIGKLEEEKLDMLVEIDDLQEEVAEVEDLAFEYFDNSERMLQTEEYACCVIKNNKYYHKPYFCFGFITEIENMFMIDDAKKFGYMPCPKCY